MPTSPLKEFEYEISTLMASDKVNPINVNYYIHELTKMKHDAYKYPIYSHLGVYLPEYGVFM